MNIELKAIDLTKGEECRHPDIRTDGTEYLVFHRGEFHAGSFNEEWYGLIFRGWSHNPVGLQYDTPGFNSSDWQAVWQIIQ